MKKLETRSFNIFRNATISIFCQFIAIVMGFVCRKALIQSLGLAYVGVTSLFSSIISLLSFVELGIGNAIVYSLYKPIADNDQKVISSYIRYYKKLYTIIAIVIFSIGSCAVPFIPNLVSIDYGIKENVYLMYFLTLAATSCTYLFASQKTLLIADQKQYIEKIVYQICHVIQITCQIVVLVKFKNYYLYLILQIIFALVNNITSALIVTQKYTFLKNESTRISKDRKINLFSDVKCIFLYKIGSSFLNYITNIFISYFCGLVILGKIANYILVLSTLSAVISQVTSAFSASVGNKRVSENGKNGDATFFKSLFVTVWIAGFFFTGYLLFANPLLTILYGKDCLVEYNIVFIIGLLYFVQDVHSISTIYRYSLGVFKKGKFAPLIASVINIVLSYVFYKLIGIPGLYVSTIISRVVTLGISDSYLINGDRKGVLAYFRQMVIYMSVLFSIFIPAYYISSKFIFSNMFILLIGALVFTVMFNLIWIMIFCKTDNFRYIISKIKPILKHNT